MTKIRSAPLTLFIILLASCTSSNPSSRSEIRSEIQSHSSQQAAPSIIPKVEEVKQLLIGAIKKKGYDKMNGCGCYFKTPKAAQELYWLHGGPYLFVENDENEVVMNIDGQDVDLTLVTSNAIPSPSNQTTVGDKSTCLYRAGDMLIYLDYVITNLCDPKDNNADFCEWADADGTITVGQGNRKQTIKIKGGCGC